MEALQSSFLCSTPLKSPSHKPTRKPKPRPTIVSCSVTPDPWTLSDGNSKNLNKPKPRSKHPKNPLSDDNARRIIKAKAQYLSALRRNQGSQAMTPKWIKRTPEQMVQYLEDDRNGNLYGKHVVAAIKRVRSLSVKAEGSYDMREVMGSFVTKLTFREMCVVLKEQRGWRQVRDFFAWMKLQRRERNKFILCLKTLNIMSLEEYYSRVPFSAQPHPWLANFFHEDDNKQKQTFFSLSKNRTILELRNKKVCASAHDSLMLLDYDSGDCYIWNPISNDKIQIPPFSNIRSNKLQCLLSAPPHDRNQCSILFFDPPTSFYFYKPSYDKKIHKHDIKIIIEGQQSYLTICTVFKGKFYGLTFPGSILVHLDLDHDLGIVTVAPLVNQRAYRGEELIEIPRWFEYLIQSSCDGNDMLLCVIKLCYGWILSQAYGFIVYRFDFEEKAWVKMESIGETAIFLCGYTGTRCSTRGNNLIKKGSIYFIEGRCVYLFDLETRKLSIVSLPCPHVSKENTNFSWLTLPHKCN